MSLRKFSAIVPDAMHEIMRLLDAKHEEKGSVVRESVREDAQACIEGDLVVENRPVDPRKRAMRVREGKQLELGLNNNKVRRN